MMKKKPREPFIKAMKVEEYMRFEDSVKRTLNVIDKNKALNEACLGIASESGEIINEVRKHLYQGHELNLDKVRDEFGDVCAYLGQLAVTLGFTFNDAMHDNIIKRMKRFPKGFTTKDSIARVDIK